IVQLLYLHIVLLLALFGASEASGSFSAKTRGGCPLSRLQAAFQTPFNSLSMALHGPTMSSSSNSRPWGAVPSFEDSPIPASAGAAAPRWVTAGASVSRSARLLRSRKVDVLPLGMSAVETKQGNKRAAESEPESTESKAEKKARRMATSSTPLGVHVIGLSHHNAGVDVREKLAVPELEWNDASAKLCEFPNIKEAAVLSTCNRFEVYIASHDSHAAIRDVMTYLQEHSGLSQAELRQNLFMLSLEDAVWHLLKVSAGLDSLVVGEGQILSQVRQCYLRGTEEEGSAGKVVARLLNTAVSAGKRARSETSISKGAVSISSAAVEFSNMRAGKDLDKTLMESTVAIIGAGKMTRLLLVHLGSLGMKKVILVNRSMPKCQELIEEFPDMHMDVRLGAEDPTELERAIGESDIVFTSTSATGCIVTKDQLERLGSGKDRPVMFVDISVPRNVEADCSDVPGVFAYDVDDLKMVVARNTALRRREMLEAEDILAEEHTKFSGWQQSLTATPAISKMQEKFEGMRAQEMRKAGNKLTNLSKKEIEVVEKLSKGIVNKMLHGPMSALRQPDGPEEKKLTLKILKAMFKLDKL
ncbi:unnamed protein product, partial [Laminaria digitata]